MYTKTNLIFEHSKAGKTAVKLPELDVPAKSLTEVFNPDLLRKEHALLPEVSEPEVIRHYTNLSVKNHHVDRDFYPLGSCTMKYNPKVNDVISSFAGFTGLHPDQSEQTAQGALQVFYDTEQMLKKITGMCRVTLQPSAGAQGEFVGALIMQKYHQKNGENRNYILIPETAHGTNPATVKLAGLLPKVVKSDERGRVDLNDLKSKADENCAGMMLTQPNTLGLFEDRIKEITGIIHDVGGLMYMDGANLNALIGIALPSDMGFDITHINLHKTFSTPHGGGGPGSGPIAVVEKLIPFLPVPMVEKISNDNYSWNFNFPDTIGPIHSYFGNFSIILRAWAYLLTMGESGLREMTQKAILNANYLKSILRDKYDIPFGDGTMHEFVLSAVKQKQRGARALDIAKTLLDNGFHAPTIYFPLSVPEAMMIEPTETETKETLDIFANTLLTIDETIDTDLESVLNAPQHTPVQRLDETKANRYPDLRWHPKSA